MNIKYKVLSKSLYKLVKKEEYWDDKDLDLVDSFAKMIKDEVAKVKRAEIYQAKKNEAIPEITTLVEPIVEQTIIEEPVKKITDSTELLKKIEQNTNIETNIETVPTTLFERIHDEDSIDTKLIKQIELEKIEKVTETPINPNGLHRFIIHIETIGDFIQDTNFQKFMIKKLDNKNFMNDEIVSTTTTYVAVIDEINEYEIRRKITPMLSSVQVFKIMPVAPGYILPQFKDIWNNQTLI